MTHNDIAAVRRYIKERLKQHTENYRLWESGFLNPTEHDEEERDCVMRELQACIIELRGLLTAVMPPTPPAKERDE